MLTLIYAYDQDVTHHTKTTITFYMGVKRLAWSIGLGWIVFACVKGYGGPVNSILAWGAWAPLAKLTYSCYLVHLTMVYWIHSQPTHRMLIVQPLVVMYCLGSIC